MSEYELIKRDLVEVRKEMRETLTGVRSEIKELAQALRDLIRLDGDLTRVADMTARVGKEIDELASLMRVQYTDTDKRLRSLETTQAGNNKSVGLFDGLVAHVLSLAVGLVVGAVVMKAVS